MSNSSVYILSTRSLSPAVVEAAVAKGVRMDILPFISVEPLTWEAGRLPPGSLTAVFTSANAVTALGKNIAAGWKVFCLDGATRRQAVEYFGQTAIAGTAGSARELAEEIIVQQADREVWFFCGDKRRDELPHLLKQAGIMIHEIVVYRTRLIPHRIERTYDAIAFFSPSAVESFFSVNALPSDVPLFAIGGTTAGAIRRRCNNPVTQSDRPDEEALIHQIIKNIQH